MTSGEAHLTRFRTAEVTVFGGSEVLPYVH